MKKESIKRINKSAERRGNIKQIKQKEKMKQ
jgi:hypothetical protein